MTIYINIMKTSSAPTVKNTSPIGSFNAQNNAIDTKKNIIENTEKYFRTFMDKTFAQAVFKQPIIPFAKFKIFRR